MSEQTLDTPKSPEQLSEILLVLDKEQKKIQAVKGIDKKGKLETVEPIKKNQNQFMRVDKNGDLFSNFFSNFFSQLKEPTRFSFFKVPEPVAIDMVNEMQKQMGRPSPEGEQLMKQYEVKAEPDKNNNKQENKNSMATTQTTSEKSEYRYKPEQIDWETMNSLGLNKEKLEKMNLLDPLLRGFKTNELVPVSLNLGTAVTRMDARLSLQQNDKGVVVVAIHGIRKEPNLNFAFFGHEFSKEDKENLLQTSNMGRVVNLTNPKTNETIPSIVSVDRLTNELVALRTDKIKIPDEIKGVKLDDVQKQTLMEGKPIHIEGMTSKKGTSFDAEVQFNADKRFVEFLFDRNNTNKQLQNNEQSQSKETPKTFRGKELDNEQYKKFKDGQTVYVSGLVDKKGKEYNGYITFNKETNKTDFSFQNPNRIKEQAKPTEAHKTQTAVNSEGKTNEGTKNLKEPLKSGQKNPDSKEQQEQQEAAKTPAKSKGRKM
ncbi:DUF3945 domain-containing protein [Flavobacterium granuli]|uniref:Uncharacterized protein DUF3945 n=1 Tax=Flavobacterium granuli TaxID=280093 RepID=A0A1M5Q6P4_9FLAO|nr:DUF3945 domain-containing protein [Flavobacterium granuli]PRZ22085.1 uncharacterized protein DUF3945 [Flavobacterium granuli]SHH09441.1 Protein of unknown function [Flavobacterium granuli]